jgi:hypothetical protein
MTKPSTRTERGTDYRVDSGFPTPARTSGGILLDGVIPAALARVTKGFLKSKIRAVLTL